MSRRGENIYKRKDGRWEARYKKYRDFFGKTHYGYLYAKSYGEVKEKLDGAKKNLELVENNIQKKDSVRDICNLWLYEIKTQNKYSTYVKYYNIAKNHIIPILGDYKVQALNTAQIKNFVNYSLNYGNLNNGGGLSAKTVKDYVSVVRLIIAFAHSLGIICPAKIDEIKIAESQPSIFVLNDSQTEKLTEFLLRNINNTNLGILISLYTGIRLGEVCALKFGDISFQDNVMSVRRTMQRIQNFDDSDVAKTKIIVSSPKSNSSIRDIPLPDFIVRIIKSHFCINKDAYVLSGRPTSYVEPRTFENRFKSVAKQCGIENVKFHTLRHTFATHSVECGFETKSLSEILGHSSVNITLNRYVHSSMETKRINMEKIAHFNSFNRQFSSQD